MSRLNTLLTEVKNKLLTIDDDTISLRGRVVIAYNEDDLLDLVKGIKSYPAVGIVYEGMRSMVEKGSTKSPASVTMKEGSLVRTTRRPLMKPTSTASAKASNIDTHSGTPN